MAIKVIKHGTGTFRVVCPKCGCEFEYELEDIEEIKNNCTLIYGDTVKIVKCPDCGEEIKHKEYTKEPSPINPTYPSYPWPSIPTYPGYPNYPWITWTTTTGTELDCDKCPNKPDPNNPVVGDTPCTWCKKNQPYCYTGDKFPEGYTGGSTGYTTNYLAGKNK